MRILLTRSPELFSPRSISPDSKMCEQDSDNMTYVPGCLLQDKPCQVPLLTNPFKRVPFGSPFCQKLGPLFTIFGSPRDCGTVKMLFLTT